MPLSSTSITIVLALALAAPAPRKRSDPQTEATRQVAHADKIRKAGKADEAIDAYWQALAAAARIADLETRYARANQIRLRIAEAHLEAHRIDHDDGHLDAAQAVLDEYVKVRNPAERQRAQELYDEIDRRRHAAPAPVAPPLPPPPSPPAVPPPQPTHRPTSIARPMLIAGASLTALGGVATIGMIAALVVHNDAAKDVDDATTPDAKGDAVDRRDSARAGAIASGVIAAAAFGAGVPLLGLAMHRRRSLRVTASPAIGPRGVTFAITGRF
jgi:hypothetical protein